MAWIVQMESDHALMFGPFDTEDDCYSFAATVSREPNDWLPIELVNPEVAALREP